MSRPIVIRDEWIDTRYNQIAQLLTRLVADGMLGGYLTREEAQQAETTAFQLLNAIRLDENDCRKLAERFKENDILSSAISWTIFLACDTAAQRLGGWCVDSEPARERWNRHVMHNLLSAGKSDTFVTAERSSNATIIAGRSGHSLAAKAISNDKSRTLRVDRLCDEPKAKRQAKALSQLMEAAGLPPLKDSTLQLTLPEVMQFNREHREAKLKRCHWGKTAAERAQKRSCSGCTASQSVVHLLDMHASPQGWANPRAVNQSASQLALGQPEEALSHTDSALAQVAAHDLERSADEETASTSSVLSLMPRVSGSEADCGSDDEGWDADEEMTKALEAEIALLGDEEEGRSDSEGDNTWEVVEPAAPHSLTRQQQNVIVMRPSHVKKKEARARRKQELAEQRLAIERRRQARDEARRVKEAAKQLESDERRRARERQAEERERREKQMAREKQAERAAKKRMREEKRIEAQERARLEHERKQSYRDRWAVEATEPEGLKLRISCRKATALKPLVFKREIVEAAELLPDQVSVACEQVIPRIRIVMRGITSSL